MLRSARAGWSSGWRSSCKARCSCVTRRRPLPMRSAPPGSAATGAMRSAPSRPASTHGRSWSGPPQRWAEVRQPSPSAARVALPWRLLLMLVGLLDAATGLWALADPRGWFDKFPGFGHHLVSGQGGAFNEHLASDAGAGFLAVG